MRKLATFISVFALAVALSLAGTTSTMAAGKGPKVSGVVSQFSGTYVQDAPALSCPDTTLVAGPACMGDLVTCPVGEAIAVSKTTFYLLDNICDDVQPNSSGLPACAGRFTALIEECSDPAAPGRDIKIDGTLLSVLSRGQVQVCFDTAATGDCTTPLVGTEMVIGTGTTLTQTRFLPGGTTPASATTENTETSSTTFFDPADGRTKKLAGAFSPTISHVTAQQNDGANCSGGCGLAGVSVTTH